MISHAADERATGRTFELHVLPGADFRREVEANASRGRTTPERWLKLAVEQLARLLPIMTEGDGVLVAGKGDELVEFEGSSIAEYRAGPSCRVTPGITPADLGGYPPGTLIWKVEVDEASAAIIQEHTRADSPYEAIGYAIWRQSRFVNTLREDYPDWEPGILLRDGIFRSLTSQGSMRRLPASTFEPSVPFGRPIRDTIEKWFELLVGAPPAWVDLSARTQRGTFSRGLFYAAADLSHAARVSERVLEDRPLIELVLFGPSSEKARCLCIVHHTEIVWTRKEDSRISIDNLLHDPVSLLQMRGYWKRHPASGLIVTAGVVGCVHGLAPRLPCSRCPEWSAEPMGKGRDR